MTDNFAEQLVKKKPGSSDNTKKLMIILGAVIITAVTMYLAFVTGLYLILAITMGVIYGAYYFFRDTNIEYEYTFTNGELDVDKIIGQRRRKHLITINIAKLNDFGEVNADTPDNQDATLFLCSDNTDEGEYYADAEDEEYGKVRLIFTPSEKMVSYIEAAMPRIIKYRKQR